MLEKNYISKIKFISIFLFLICTMSIKAWDGYDYSEGEYIEIGKGNLVRPEREIEVYHSSDCSYHYEEVQGIYGKELETYNYEDGEYHYYEMD